MNNPSNVYVHSFDYIYTHACNCAVLCLVAQLCPTLRPRGLQPARLLCPWGFSRKEYWRGLPCPPPGDLPNPGIKPRPTALQADSLPSEPPEKPNYTYINIPIHTHMDLYKYLYINRFCILMYVVCIIRYFKDAIKYFLQSILNEQVTY